MIRTAFLLTLLTGILVVLGGVFGGKTGMVIALAIGLGLNFFNYWFSGSLVLKAHKAQLIDSSHPQLGWVVDDVREMAAKADMPMPKVAFIPHAAPNAFATGRNPANAVVAVTAGLIELCDRREVRAVMGHELGHVQNRDMLVMTIVAGAVSAIGMLAMMARWGAMFGAGGGDDDDGGASPIAMIAVALLAPIMAMLVQMAISRTREYGADKSGAGLADDPLALASALERLHSGIPARPALSATGATAHMMIANPFFGKSLGQLFSTHPDPNERIRRLRAMA